MTKLILAAALALVALAAPASAGSTCNQIGQFTYCSDTNGNRVTCNRIGQFTYCN
jgi:hypothetical protein